MDNLITALKAKRAELANQVDKIQDKVKSLESEISDLLGIMDDKKDLAIEITKAIKILSEK